MHRLSLHGLEIDSAYALVGWRANCGAGIDLRILAATTAPPQRDRSTAIAGRSGPSPLWVFRDGATFEVVVPEVARFSVRSDVVHVAACAGQPRERIELLLEGTVLSTVVLARGELALHASAVRSSRGTVAFVGNSGAGKSTLAALMCVAGGQLVADDVVRIVHDETRARCFGGTSRLRLRSGARELAALLPSWSASETFDGRLALAPPSSAPASTTLDAVIVPRFDASGTALGLRRLRGVEAVTELLGAPRVPGWSDPEVLRLMHSQLSALVRTTPVFLATLPRLAFNELSAAKLDELVAST